MAAILMERAQAAARVETTKGTANAPIAADGGIEIWDLGVTPTVGVYERETLGATFDKPSGVPGERFYEATFRVPIKGRASAGLVPEMGILLRAAGLAQALPGATVDYAPIQAEASQETITLDLYRDGKRWRLTGTMANVTLEVRKNIVPYFEFTFIGIYAAPSDTALLTSPPYILTAPPQPLTATFTLMSQTMIATGFSFNLGNEVRLRHDITQATGFRNCVIVNRDPTISLDPEDELVATFDFLNRLTTGAVGEFVFQYGTAAGNTFRFRAPAAQIIEAPYADRDGLLTRSLTLRPRKLVAAGDDSFLIRFQ
jgi:hypothetical protein